MLNDYLIKNLNSNIKKPAFKAGFFCLIDTFLVGLKKLKIWCLLR